MAMVVVPAARKLEPRQRTWLIAEVGRRFRIIGWACIGLLVVTGLVSLAFRGVGWESVVSGRLWAGPFGQVLAAKVALVAVMIVLSAAHDFVLGPASTRMAERPGAASLPEAEAMRRRAAWVARANAATALVVIGLAVLLVRGAP